MGGPGSGSVKGKNASHWKGGIWANVEKKRKQARRMGPNMVVDHIQPVVRDKKNHNQVVNNERLQRSSNLRIISKSANTRKGNKRR